ncbi:MAG: hypothetical protein Q4A39_04075 [Eubacteriales bacterium]|nr:hypothetical protein [Eubacteriales bacterium]
MLQVPVCHSEVHTVPVKNGSMRIENFSPLLSDEEHREIDRSTKEALFRIFTPHFKTP